jgi:hypothetical protein
VGGRLLLGDDTSFIACAVDDAGVVAIGSVTGSLALFGLGSTGADIAFGDGGILPIEVDGGGNIDRAGVAIDEGAVLALASAREAVYLRRYLRDGRPDTSFGASGSCALPALGVRAVLGIAPARDRKLLVFAQGASDTLLLRIWL